MQDVCVKISSAGSGRSTCKISVCESLVQDVCVKISSGRSCRTTCTISLYASLLCISLCEDLCVRILYDLLCKISVCGSLVHISVSGSLHQESGSCMATCARSLYADLLCKISLSGSLHQDLCRTTCTKRNFTCISRDGHARSPQRVAVRNRKAPLYQHSVRSTRTICAEGCASKSENATLKDLKAAR